MSGSLGDLTAVSYTHLDVYKRQSNKFIRTAFKRHEFNDDSELIMEVLKKYGI